MSPICHCSYLQRRGRSRTKSYLADLAIEIQHLVRVEKCLFGIYCSPMHPALFHYKEHSRGSIRLTEPKITAVTNWNQYKFVKTLRSSSKLWQQSWYKGWERTCCRIFTCWESAGLPLDIVFKMCWLGCLDLLHNLGASSLYFLGSFCP